LKEEQFEDFSITSVIRKRFYFLSLGNKKIKPASLFIIPRKQYQTANRPKKPRFLFKQHHRIYCGAHLRYWRLTPRVPIYLKKNQGVAIIHNTIVTNTTVHGSAGDEEANDDAEGIDNANNKPEFAFGDAGVSIYTDTFSILSKLCGGKAENPIHNGEWIVERSVGNAWHIEFAKSNTRILSAIPSVALSIYNTTQQNKHLLSGPGARGKRGSMRLLSNDLGRVGTRQNWRFMDGRPCEGDLRAFKNGSRLTQGRIRRGGANRREIKAATKVHDS
jgi:hypothetical protein